MRFVDTHCHVGFKAYAEDADAVIRRAIEEQVTMVTVGTMKQTSEAAAALANKYEPLYASIGLHPTHSIAHGFNDTQELDFKPKHEVFDAQAYEAILQTSKKIVAIGETGLDYYRLPPESEKEMKRLQWEATTAQFAFAKAHDLPVIVHCRDAHDDMVSVIKEQGGRGVIHCFTGTYEEAKRYVEMGWIISFSGIATFAKEVGEVAGRLPLESIVIETDAPYLTPPPFRGKRNEPLYVKYVAESIAKRRGMPVEAFAEATALNAIKLFRLPI